MPSSRLSPSLLLSVSLSLLLSLSATPLLPAAAPYLEPVRFTVSEGTNIAVARSPDGQLLAFDLQGTLFILPAAGGDAKAITDGLGDDRQPAFSPDGTRLAFQSFRDGNFHIWSSKPDGTDLRQHTRGPYDHREPMWSPDGKKILLSSDRAAAGSYDLWELDVATSQLTPLTKNPGDDFQPAYSPDGTTIAFVTTRADGPGIYLRTADGTEKKLVALGGPVTNPQNPPPAPNAPAWSPDGNFLSYQVAGAGATSLNLVDVTTGTSRVLSAEGEDVFPFRAAWLDTATLLYTADGKIKRLSFTPTAGAAVTTVPFAAPLTVNRAHYTPKTYDFTSTTPKPVKGIRAPVVSPDGTQIAFTALGDLWLLTVGNPKPQKLTDDVFFDADPAWAPDGQRLAFVSDRTGNFEVYVMTLADKKILRLTATPVDESLPSWTPDGNRVAFMRQAPGNHVYTTELLNIETRESRTLQKAVFQPSRPSFSPDGRLALMTAVETYAARFREGISTFNVIDVAAAKSRLDSPFATQSLALRLRNGPAWSPDGRSIAYVKDDLLWTLAVDASGKFTGAPQQHTRELTDSPSWTADSKTIVYLATDRLKKVDLATGVATDIPLDLTWANAPATGITVVRAGRFFDGIKNEIRTDIDVVITGNKITALRPAGAPLPAGAKLIDASQQTVMPGLFEMHTHLWSHYGERIGRLWLAYGITGLRETGGDPATSLEQRETWRAGRRPGPMFFITGPLLDGTRVYYGYSHPVADDANLALELDRVKRLDYDFIKTYVRMPDLMQRQVAAFAREQGIRISSHEIYPATAYGVDAVEHLGATSRRGYSPKYTFLGKGYDDVIQIISRSGMFITPTLSLQGGYPSVAGRDPSIFETPQFKMYPEYFRDSAKASAKANAASGSRSRSYENGGATVKKLHDAGANISAGTDSPFIPWGLSLHVELWNYVESGLTPFEALQTATINAARALHLESQLGSLEVGKIANLIAVDGNPLENIRDTQRIRHVLINGHAHTLEELLRAP